MNNKEISIFIITFLLICLMGVFLAPVGHNYDLKKCKTVTTNDYYYAKSGCYNPLHAPNLNLSLYFIAFTCLPFVIWGLCLALKWDEY